MSLCSVIWFRVLSTFPVVLPVGRRVSSTLDVKVERDVLFMKTILVVTGTKHTGPSSGLAEVLVQVSTHLHKYSSAQELE